MDNSNYFKRLWKRATSSKQNTETAKSTDRKLPFWMIFVAWINIFTQIFIPFSLVISQVAKAAPQNSSSYESNSRTQNSVDLEEYAKNQIKSQATSAATKEVQDWLAQWGTTEARLNIDDHGNLAGSNIDMLLPFDEDEDGLFFTQFGVRFSNVDYDKTTANLGLGYRHYNGDVSTFGYNAFLDHQFQNAHTRLGLGVEYHRANFKAYANGYFGLTGWKDSDYLLNYEEKPANGFDLRLEGYLPDHPQLGAKVEYEQYFGDEVALFNVEGRSRNPHAFTFGVNYTPIPLLTFGVDHRTGSNSQNDTQFNVALNYSMGVPFEQQLESKNVEQLRSVIGQRHSLVQRNNEIVLKYRKAEYLYVSTRPIIAGYEGDEFPLDLKSGSTHGIDRFVWDWREFEKNSGILSDPQNSNAYVKLPPYIPGGNNRYVITVYAVDKNGNRSNISTTVITVLPPAVAPVLVPETGSPVVADGNTPNTITGVIRDKEGNPIPNTDVELTIPDNYPNACFEPIGANQTCAPQFKKRTVPTNPDGSLPPVYIYSNVPGPVPVEINLPSFPGVVIPPINVPFGSDLTGKVVKTQIDVLHTGAIGNGKDVNEVRVTTKNDKGENLPFTEVEITTPNSGVKFIDPLTGNPVDTLRVITNGNGEIDVKLTRTVIGNVTINVVAINNDTPVADSGSSTTVNFVPDPTSPTITLTPNNPSAPAIADGTTPNDLTVTLKDPKGNPLPNTKVELTLDPNNPNICFAPITVGTPCAAADKVREVTTGPDGTVPNTVPVYSSEGGDFPIIAKIPGTNTPATEGTITFTPVPDLVIKTVTPNGVIANGKTPNEVEVILTDLSGTGIPNEKVTLTLDPANPQICFNQVLAVPNTVTCEKTIEVTTGPDGKSTTPVYVYSTQTGTPTVTAEYKDPANPSNVLTPSTDVKFVPDVANPKITLTPNNPIIADGNTPNDVTVKVTDPNGNPLPPGTTVELTLDPNNPNICFVPVTVGTPCAAQDKVREVTPGPDGTVPNKVPVYSTEGGDFPLTGKVPGTTVPPTSEIVKFTPVPELKITTVTPNGVIADGKTPNEVEVTLTDLSGTGIPNQKVTLTLDPANPQICFNQVLAVPNTATCEKTIEVTTGPNGKVTVPVYSTETSTPTVTASHPVPAGIPGAPELVKTTVVKFSPDINNAVITLTPTLIPVANGTNPNPVEITVRDPQGNLLPEGTIIELTLDPTDITCFVPLATINTLCSDKTKTVTVKADGTIGPVDVYSFTIGSPNLSAQLQNITSTKVTEGVPFVDRFTIEAVQVVKDGAVADGQQRNTVQFLVKDSKGNIAGNQSVTLTNVDIRFCKQASPAICNAQGEIVVQSDADGLVTVDLAAISVNTFNIVATLTNADKSDTTGQKANLDVNFIDFNLTLTPPVKHAFVGGGNNETDLNLVNTVTGKVTDTNNTVIANANVLVTSSDPDAILCSSSGCNVGSIIVTTDNQGDYSVNIMSPTVGEPTVTATIVDMTSTTPTPVDAAKTQTTKIEFRTYIITSGIYFGTQAPADEISQTPVFIYVKDNKNIFYPNIKVKAEISNGQRITAIQTVFESMCNSVDLTPLAFFNVSNGILTTEQGDCSTNQLIDEPAKSPSGRAFISYVSNVAQTAKVNFSLVDYPNVTTTNDISFVPDPNNVVITILSIDPVSNTTGNKQPIIAAADNSNGYTIRAIVKDKNGNIFKNQTVITTVNKYDNTGTNSTVISTNNSFKTDTDGIVEFTLQNQAALGYYKVVFSVNGKPASTEDFPSTGEGKLTMPFYPDFSEPKVFIPDNSLTSGTTFVLGANDTFPQTAFNGGIFELQWKNIATTVTQDFQFTIESTGAEAPTLSSPNNRILFGNKPTGVITITVKHPLFGLDNPDNPEFIYQFNAPLWFINTTQSVVNYSGASALCTSNSSSLPTIDQLAPVNPTRRPGSLWGEWANQLKGASGTFWSITSGTSAGEYLVVDPNGNRVSTSQGTPNNFYCLVN